MNKFNTYALNNSLCLFNGGVVFRIIPSQLELKPKILHKKYKKHIFEFANKIETGELKKVPAAVGFGYIPDFIKFLEQKYKTNKLLYVKNKL